MTNENAEEKKAEEFDLVLTSAINARYDYATAEAQRILHESAEQVKAAGIWARPTLSADRETVTYRIAIEHPDRLDFQQWAFQVAHFLYDVRATLDNIMWMVVHDRPLGALTAKQEEGVYFPMAREQARWEGFERGPIGRVIRPTLLKRLEEVQPFRQPAHPGLAAGLQAMSKIHLGDKHRVPIAVHLVPDRQLPLPFLRGSQQPEQGELWAQVGNLSRPIAEGAHLKTTRYVAPVVGEPEDVQLAPVPVVVLDGETYDLQDLMWDAQAALLRVIDTVCIGNTFRADLWDADVAWRREGIAALNRSLADGTDEWERRRFNRVSPYIRVAEEMAKDDPDLDSVFPIDV